MFNAPVTSKRYGCLMRSLLQQLSRRRVYDSTPDQMRRLIDLVIACALFALTAPLMLLVSVAIRLEAEGPILVRVELHWVPWASFPDAEIPDGPVRFGSQRPSLGS